MQIIVQESKEQKSNPNQRATGKHTEENKQSEGTYKVTRYVETADTGTDNQHV